MAIRETTLLSLTSSLTHRKICLGQIAEVTLLAGSMLPGALMATLDASIPEAGCDCARYVY